MNETIDLETLFCNKFGEVIKRSSSSPQIFFFCPACNHSGLSCNTQSGKFHCFHCGFGRGEQKLLGLPSGPKQIETDQTLQISVVNRLIQLSSLDSDHRKYLVERGILNPEKFKIITVPSRSDLLLKEFSKDQLVASGLFERDEEGKLYSYSLEWRRILIPYWHGEEIIGCKTRANPFNLNYSIRYSIPRGAKVGSNLFFKDFYNSKDLIVTEGELKCLATSILGYNCVGFPGISISNKALLQLADIIKNLKVERVFIIFDTMPNMETRVGEIRQALKLAKTFKNSAISFLPKEVEKVDLDSFLQKNDLDDFDSFLETSWKNREKNFKYWTQVYNRNKWRNEQRYYQYSLQDG